MIVSSDPEYIETKRIKRGEQKRLPIFDALAIWIEQTYRNLTVLNAYYDTIRSASGWLPRLNIIFEYEADERRFLTPEGNFNRAEAAAIASAFVELNREYDARFATTYLLVTFSAFDRIAREEATTRVSEPQLENLVAMINNPTIWKLRNNGSGITLFFYTEAQRRALETAEFRSACTKAYNKLLIPYDEFGYFMERPAEVIFDSKENFDAKFEGNWFNYDR